MRLARGARRAAPRPWAFAAALLLLPLTARALTITPVDAAGLKQAIAAQKGHVVVVNLWATYCGPCVAEFPQFVKLARQDRRQGLVFLAVSTDSQRDVNGKVRAFYAKQGQPFQAYIVRGKDPEDFINGFDPSWQGDLPRTFIYDRHGRRVKTLAGEQTPQTLAAAVAPLLK